MNRVYRKLAGWIGIVAVVFTQFAVSVYACPLLLQSLNEGADTVSLSDPTSGSPDFVSAGLCQKHCENGQQNVNDSPQPLLSDMLAPTFVVSQLINPPEPLPVMALAPSLLRATSPPLSIRNCCFRI